MLKHSETEARLQTMLRETGFDLQNPDPQVAWQVFQLFAQEPVDCAGDGILFQCGVFGFGDSGKRFYLDFVRQFEFEDEDGEYDHMEQLHCEFTREPNGDLAKVEKNLWSFDFNSLPDYFRAVKALPEFQLAIRQSNWVCKVEQENV